MLSEWVSCQCPALKNPKEVDGFFRIKFILTISAQKTSIIFWRSTNNLCVMDLDFAYKCTMNIKLAIVLIKHVGRPPNSRSLSSLQYAMKQQAEIQP